MKKIFKLLFEWALKEELAEMRETQRNIKAILGNMDVSVDVQHHAPSWAVISIQGEKRDYIKFVNLGDRDLFDIRNYMRQFEHKKVDCSPYDRSFFFEDKLY